MALKKKKLVTNIIFYTLIVIFYGFVLFAIITKFNEGSVYLFGARYDVVLTDSMSAKNENHLDYLEGTTQIQALDVVKSRKVDDNTELKEKDVVLFRNPDMNNATVMHRIVNVIPKGNELRFVNIEKTEFQSETTIKLIDYGSAIALSVLDVVEIDLEFLTPEKYDDNFTFIIGGNAYSATYTEAAFDGYYKYNVKCTRSTTHPLKSIITLGTENDSYITYLEYVRSDGSKIQFYASDYDTDESSFSKLFDVYYLYEIRADKAKDSDGIFGRDKILSKVENVIPKAGYVVRFITSIPGIVMFIGMALLITVASYFYNKEPKKKEEIVEETVTEQKGETNEKQTKE